MNKENIIRMAHEAQFEGFGNGDWVCTTEEIERFAALVEDAQAKRMHAEGMVTVGHMRQQIAAQRQPLIDGQITRIIDSMPGKFSAFMKDWDLYDFTRAIETAHGITGEKT
jgi:hypothetical protein